MSLNRLALAKELADLKSNPPLLPILKVGPPDEADLLYWQAVILGPEGTPYEGGKFLVEIRLPPDYPFKAPFMLLLTKIYHPTFNDRGNHDIDGFFDQWTPL